MAHFGRGAVCISAGLALIFGVPMSAQAASAHKVAPADTVGAGYLTPLSGSDVGAAASMVITAQGSVCASSLGDDYFGVAGLSSSGTDQVSVLDHRGCIDGTFQDVLEFKDAASGLDREMALPFDSPDPSEDYIRLSFTESDTGTSLTVTQNYGGYTSTLADIEDPPQPVLSSDSLIGSLNEGTPLYNFGGVTFIAPTIGNNLKPINQVSNGKTQIVANALTVKKNGFSKFGIQWKHD